MLQPIEIEVEKYTEEDYRDMLDDCYPEVSVGGISWSASAVLEEMDPTAFHCGFSDYQEYETKYQCPICGDEHSDEDDALYCCQEYGPNYQCPVCGTEYESEDEANECCIDDDEDNSWENTDA
jgi:predicted RNA-binding Zn-ribbon protein involved in translation (DUF1610 family)